MRGLDVERVEQRGRVVGHVRDRVRRGLFARDDGDGVGDRRAVEVRRVPGVAVVEREHEEAELDELVQKVRVPGDELGAVAVDEEHRRVRIVAADLVADLDPVRVRPWHYAANPFTSSISSAWRWSPSGTGATWRWVTPASLNAATRSFT